MKPRSRPLKGAGVLPVLASLAALAVGCYRGGGGSPNPFRPSDDREGQVSVRVDNQNYSDATVYVLRQGERIRLGLVTGLTEESFTLRWRFSLPMEFQVHLIGGPSCTPTPLTVDPGDRIWVRVPVSIGPTPCETGK